MAGLIFVHRPWTAKMAGLIFVRQHLYSPEHARATRSDFTLRESSGTCALISVTPIGGGSSHGSSQRHIRRMQPGAATRTKGPEHAARNRLLEHVAMQPRPPARKQLGLRHFTRLDEARLNTSRGIEPLHYPSEHCARCPSNNF